MSWVLTAECPRTKAELWCLLMTDGPLGWKLTSPVFSNLSEFRSWYEANPATRGEYPFEERIERTMRRGVSLDDGTATAMVSSMLGVGSREEWYDAIVARRTPEPCQPQPMGAREAAELEFPEV